MASASHYYFEGKSTHHAYFTGGRNWKPQPDQLEEQFIQAFLNNTKDKPDSFVQPHSLCDDCKRLCCRSKIIRDLECMEIKNDRSALEEEFMFHSNLRRLMAGYLGGCHLCALVWHKLDQIQKDRLLDLDERFWDAPHHNIIASIASMETSGGNEKSKRYKRFRMEIKFSYPSTGLSTSSQNYLNAKLWIAQSDVQIEVKGLACTTSSQALLQNIQNWQEYCVKSHHDCQRIQLHIKRLPSRILHVEGADVSGVLRLQEAGSIPQNADYVTLSHAWGRQDSGKASYQVLERKTLAKFFAEISLQDLPKTFREAVIITRRLGFNYLWIDSLCIIQDSPEDWKTESALMSTVYGGSALNLVALGKDSHQGCFSRRNPLKLVPCKLSSDTPKAVYALHGCADIEVAFDWAPSMHRAWIAQERILAPRNVFFGGPELFWSCTQGTLSEKGPTPRLFPFGFRGPGCPEKMAIATLMQHRNSKHLGPEEMQSFSVLWHGLLKHYLCTRLSYQKDKLVAFSGVAWAIQRHSGFSYLSGLWKETFLMDSLWGCLKAGTQPEIWRAPSWSWGSIDTDEPILTLWLDDDRWNPEITIHASVLGFNIEYGTSQENIIPDVLRGMVTLQGPTKEVILGPKSTTLSFSEQYTWPGRHLSKNYHGASDAQDSSQYLFFPDRNVLKGSRALLLLVLKMKHSLESYPKRKPQKFQWVEFGLVLQAKGLANTGFVRIGSFRHYHDLGSSIFKESEIKEERVVNVW